MRTLILLFVLLLLPTFAVGNTFKFIFSTDNPKDSLHVKALQKFSELSRKYSDGEISIEVFHKGNKTNPSFGGEEENIKMVMSYDFYKISPIDGTVVAAESLAFKAPIIEFMLLPFIFPSFKSAKKLFASDFIMKYVNFQLKTKHRTKIVSWLIGGYRHLTNSKKMVSKIQDIAGLKIRTPRNYIIKEAYEAFGASVKILDWDDVAKSLKNETIDGQENPFNVFFHSDILKYRQKYLTKTKAFLWIGAIAMNARKFENMPIKLQDIIVKAGRETAQIQWDWIEKENSQLEKLLREKRVKISELEDREKWIQASRKIYDDSYKLIGYGDRDLGEDLVKTVVDLVK